MSERMPTVSVLTATTGESRRRDSLRRALASVAAQRGVPVESIVVVNGPLADPEVLIELERLPRTRVFRLETASYPAAVHFGRQQIASPYFAVLDDDDVFGPEAIAHRLRLMEESGADAVVANGNRSHGELQILDLARVEADPLGTLFERPWLTSAAGLYRSASVGIEFFDRVTKYHEWTLLAFKLVTGNRRIRFSDEPTYQLFDSAESLSKVKSLEKLETEQRVIQWMQRHTARADLREELRRREGDTLHELAEYYGKRGQVWRALPYHWRSLISRPRYLSYTRYLLKASIGFLINQTQGQ